VRFSPPIVVALVTAASLLPVATSARRLSEASSHHQAASASLALIRHRADRVQGLRDSRERAAEQKRPEQDVIARANAVLLEAGLPVEVLGAVRTQSDAEISRSSSGGGGPTYRRQNVQLTLRRLTVPEIGRFLASWTASQRLWTPAQITLVHARGEDDPARYHATIVISATYVVDR
jgi:hypothetical protein